MGYIQKTAQKQPKIVLSAGMKISKLENYKSDIMKFGRDMYHLNTFNIPKHEGVNKWAGGGGEHIQKITRKYHEFKRILTIASSKTNSEKSTSLVLLKKPFYVR